MLFLVAQFDDPGQAHASAAAIRVSEEGYSPEVILSLSGRFLSAMAASWDAERCRTIISAHNGWLMFEETRRYAADPVRVPRVVAPPELADVRAEVEELVARATNHVRDSDELLARVLAKLSVERPDLTLVVSPTSGDGPERWLIVPYDPRAA